MATQWVVIDIAEGWPGERAAYPRTPLNYSSTGDRVLGICCTREEAYELLQDCYDRSGLQQLRVVEVEVEPSSAEFREVELTHDPGCGVTSGLDQTCTCARGLEV